MIDIHVEFRSSNIIIIKMLYANHESFLSELSKLFESGRQTGKSVWITMKRYDGRTKRNPRKPNDKPKPPKKGASKTPVCQSGDLQPNEYKCLIRAKLGDRKISVAIGHKDMNRFQQSYLNLIKGNIYGLKKQQQSKSTTTTTVTTSSTTNSGTTKTTKATTSTVHNSSK